MESIDKIIALYNSPLFDGIVKAVLIYLGILWFAIVIWVGRDIINRTNNVLFQVAVILINIILPVFGLILYLIIRPSKTLLEKYYEELEYNFLAEHAHDEEKCPRCEAVLSAEFLYCPSCSEKVKSSCWNCKHAYASRYTVCPYCGKKAHKKKDHHDHKGKHKKE